MLATAANADTALALARAGLAVFPCQSGGAKAKSPMPFLKWRDASTTSEGQVRAWWQRWPDAAIGLDLAKCGLLVIDADRHDAEADGVEAFGAVMAAHGFDPDSAPLVATPSAGNHHFFRQPPGRQLGNNRGTLPSGVDVRGAGGYVIAPGTIMADGRAYELHGDLAEAPPLPDWLAAILDSPRPAPAEPAHPTRELTTGEAEVEELLNCISPDVGYHDWLAALMAVHAATGGQGFDIADRWSARGQKYPGTRELAKKWASFKGSGVSSRTLAMLAKQHGADLAAIALKHNPLPEPDGYDSRVLLESAEVKQAEAERQMLDGFLTPASSFAGLEIPRREFLDARKLLPMANITILSGDGGTGKSLLAMQLATAVATGSPWLGRPVQMGPVVYFSAEDDEIETHIRLKEISASEGLDLDVMHDLGIAMLAGKDAVLAVEDQKASKVKETPLWRTLSAAVQQEKPKLLVLDNLADVFSGNENSRPLARQFLGMLRGLAIENGCAVLLLSHPSLSGLNSGTGSSGNTAWSNSVRSRLYLRRDYVASDERGKVEENDPDARILETKKANYGRAGDEMRLRWEAGRMVAVEEPRVDPGDPLAATLKAERVFLHLLRWHLERSKFVSPNKSVSWAPKVFAAHPQAEGLKVRQFEQAMTVLLDQKRIEILTHGTMSHRRQHIGFPIGSDWRNEEV